MSNIIRDGRNNAAAARELRRIAKALGRDAEDFFELDRFRANILLANGYRVTIDIREPEPPAEPVTAEGGKL